MMGILLAVCEKRGLLLEEFETALSLHCTVI